MDACRKYGIERFHQVSTDEVYGDLPLDRPDLFFTEETPIHTSSPYSTSKASADLLVLAYHRTYGLPVTISRCSNNYGPYQFPEKLIPLMIANALHDQPLPVYGEGLNVRDWLYVEDHCKAIDLILRGGRVGEVYNIGGHNEMRNIDIVRLICQELHKPESLITYVTDRKGHDMRYAIDPTKIHRDLGWLPETKFATPPEKQNDWADHLRGATIALAQRFPLHVGLCAVLDGELPIGGLSSSAAVIISFLSVLCKLNGIHLTPEELIRISLEAENRYVGVACGTLDQSCEIYCKKDHLLYLDTRDGSFQRIPRHPDCKPFEIAVFFSGMERSLAGSMTPPPELQRGQHAPVSDYSFGEAKPVYTPSMQEGE